MLDQHRFRLREIDKIGPLLLVLISILVGCQSSQAKLADIQESDLVGTWRANYSESNADVDPTGVEIIILRPDGTYQQMYKDGNGYMYESPWYKWYMDADKLIHLEGGRWYPRGAREAEKLTNGAIESIVVRGKRVEVDLAEETLLIVYNFIGEEIVLGHLHIGDPDGFGTVYFHRIDTITPEVTSDP